MDIINLAFEKPLTLTIQGQAVELILFKTAEHSNVKVGVNAPKSLGVDRQEIYQQKQARQQLLS